MNVSRALPSSTASCFQRSGCILEIPMKEGRHTLEQILPEDQGGHGR